MPSGLSPEEEEMVAFVERDYAITQEVAASDGNAVVASRSVGFTLVAVLLGLGLSQRSWAIVALATLAGAAVYMIDGYYSWRATERDKYLKHLEKTLAANFAVLERAPNNAKERRHLATRLAGMRVGTNSQIRHFKIRDVRFNQPGPLFKFLYPLLMLSALAATAVFGLQALKDKGEERLSRCEHGAELALSRPLQIQALPKKRSTPKGMEIKVPAARLRCG